MVETTSSIAEGTPSLSERFRRQHDQIENRMSKRLRDTEHIQKEILRIIENLSSKVENLSNSSLEQGYSNSRIDTQEGS